MQQFSLLIKPASYHCNLRCTYCFYLSKEAIFGKTFHGMTLDTFRDLAKNFYSVDMPSYSFAFQGGEPTLMGVEFFENVVKIQKELLPKGKTFTNSIQTNGTLLDDKFTKFLHYNNFLTGISVDGPAEIHNHYRLKATGDGSHSDVLRGVNLLKKNKAEFNTLTLVSQSNVKHPELVYNYLCEIGSNFHQYIECVEGSEGGMLDDFALKPGEWGAFMCRIFDLWFAKDIRRVSIRLFDSILNRLVTGAPTICPMGGSCRNYFVVEHDGSIYPCDFYVQKELCLGNVANDNLGKLWTDQRFVDFGKAKEPDNDKCRSCRYLALCMGDCQKNRLRSNISLLCEDWKLFYSHTIARFEKLAAAIQQGKFQ